MNKEKKKKEYRKSKGKIVIRRVKIRFLNIKANNYFKFKRQRCSRQQCVFFSILWYPNLSLNFFCSHSAKKSTQRKIHLASAGQASTRWAAAGTPASGPGRRRAAASVSSMCVRHSCATARPANSEESFLKMLALPRPASVHVRGP